MIDKPKSKVSKHYIKKLAKRYNSLDDKMKKARYKSVERHLMFSSLSRKVKKSIANERKEQLGSSAEENFCSYGVVPGVLFVA